MTTAKSFHQKSLHNERYNFDELIRSFPELERFVKENQYNELGIDYGNSEAIHALNQAILKHYYKVDSWSVPAGQLCPAIPGRADYIHHLADILKEKNEEIIPVGTKIKGLDIGTGMSCIYPILGNSIYGWKFVGTDINPESINHAKKNLASNKTLKKNIKFRFQKSSNSIFKDIIKPDESFDFVMCNPPFYSSLEEAESEGQKKIKNLNESRKKKGHKELKSKTRDLSSFGGKNAELWCPGGELKFIKQMIRESLTIKDNCKLFSTLVSKKENLIELSKDIESTNLFKTKTIKMVHGKKISHILVWVLL